METMPRTTSVQLGEELDAMLSEELAVGEFASASEIMRVALQRLLEERRKERVLLRELDESAAEIAARTPAQREHFRLENVLKRFRARHPGFSR
jgi:putative addiction module CopG family antidote